MPINWWTRTRVENGLRRLAADYFRDRAMNLPQTTYAYRNAVPERDQRRARAMRLYPPFHAVLRCFDSLLSAWQELGFAVFYFPAKTKAAEITGWRFGWLVAICYARSERGSGRIWECLCRCGRTAYVPVKNLFRGRVVSCGCYRRTVAAKKMGLKMLKDIAGRRFGRLVAVSRTERKYQKQSVWQCLCDCGVSVEIPISSLMTGATRSCGCLRKETSKSNINFYGTQKRREK